MRACFHALYNSTELLIIKITQELNEAVIQNINFTQQTYDVVLICEVRHSLLYATTVRLRW